MNRILHDTQNAERILQMTADTLILISREGVCIDIDSHSNQWFLQEEVLLGKNLFKLLPEHTFQKILPTFEEVIRTQRRISHNYRLELSDATYYFKCIMHPYGEMVLCQYRDITERSHVKLQLERTNNELQEIQKAAHIGQWKYNTHQEIFYFSGYTGIICQEAINKIPLDRYTDMILEDDRTTVIEWLEKSKRQTNEESIDYRICVENQIYYIRLKAYFREPMPDGSFDLEGYIQDVTDVQRRRNDINTLTHAINNAKESIFAADKSGTLVFANRQFLKNHNLPEQTEVSNLKIYEIVGDMQTLEGWKRRYKQAKPDESANFIAHHPLKNDQNTLAFEGVVYHVEGDEGDVSYWSFSHDISERLRYESQIKRLNRIMDTTMKNLPASIVVKEIDNDFRYLYCNRELYDQDIDTEEVIGKNDFDYHAPDVAEMKRKEDMEIAEIGQELHKTVEESDRNGQLRVLDKRKIKVESEDFSPVIVSIEWDITQLELVKRELMAEKNKAETSDHLKSAFLANMSHEIRTPLNAIVGFSRIISESEDPDERKTYYEIVEANNERLLQLINEILDLSKIESGIVEFTIVPVKLHRLCKEIHDAHVFRCPPEVKLIFEPSDETLIIDSDKNRVFQVVSNLIGNAFKFTTEGSVSYGYRQEGDWIVFHVSDTGFGIQEDKVGRIFERFVKVNSFAQGTGLGLSICKAIIERLGGEISVSSELGKGTTLTFTLPARKVQAEQAETAAHEQATNQESSVHPKQPITEAHPGTAQEEDNKRNGQLTILIAEDTDSNYELLKAILGREYRLERALDGMEAVTLFDEVKPDLILMDIKMPSLDGLEATKIIRELSPTVPIIIQSAFAFEHDRKKAAEVGCSDFISKPIAQGKLKEMIKKYI